ncbi:deoxyribodipyrimidine photo-lyase [Deinococcus radiopugnans]|uniref:deoxyribodipyrimidine photo-lyase n=1 Tax=Deinococcus radiopugnans TaxID=57497 RepID=UPI00360F5F64
MPFSAQPGPVQLVWFKKDLRVADHAPLREAAARGPVLPLFIYEPEQLGHEEFTGQHLTYLNDCLRELDENLRRLGTPLVLLQGEAVEVLEGLSRELPLGGVWAHQETGNGVSFARDRRVRAWTRARGLPLTELPQNGVVRGMKNRDGWADAWEERLGTPPLPAPERLCGTSVPPCRIMSHAELGVEPDNKIIPPAANRWAGPPWIPS